MAYRHMKVSVLLKAHERAVGIQHSHIDTMSESELRTRALIVEEVNGVPIARELAQLCEAVRAAHRGIEFAVQPNAKSVWRNGGLVLSEIWAYFPGDEYAVMRLGWCDYSLNGSASAKYGVLSRQVRNEKYNDSRENYYMMLAETKERALANVKKLMRRYSPADIAKMGYAEFQNKLSNPVWNATNAFHRAKEDVMQHKSLCAELESLVESGYVFNDLGFAGYVKNLVEQAKERKAKENLAHHGYFVKVREHAGAQVFDVISVYDINKSASIPNEHRTYSAEELAELDEELPGKLAALSILDNSTFVEGLGTKESETCYWVLK